METYGRAVQGVVRFGLGHPGRLAALLVLVFATLSALAWMTPMPPNGFGSIYLAVQLLIAFVLVELWFGCVVGSLAILCVAGVSSLLILGGATAFGLAGEGALLVLPNIVIALSLVDGFALLDEYRVQLSRSGNPQKAALMAAPRIAAPSLFVRLATVAALVPLAVDVPAFRPYAVLLGGGLIGTQVLLYALAPVLLVAAREPPVEAPGLMLRLTEGVAAFGCRMGGRGILPVAIAGAATGAVLAACASAGALEGHGALLVSLAAVGATLFWAVRRPSFTVALLVLAILPVLAVRAGLPTATPEEALLMAIAIAIALEPVVFLIVRYRQAAEEGLPEGERAATYAVRKTLLPSLAGGLTRVASLVPLFFATSELWRHVAGVAVGASVTTLLTTWALGPALLVCLESPNAESRPIQSRA